MRNIADLLSEQGGHCPRETSCDLIVALPSHDLRIIQLSHDNLEDGQ